jgi:Domain of unknown function (DUF4252)
MKYALVLFFAIGPLLAQDVKLPADIDKLAAKASEVVDVSLDGAMLRLAGRFLSNNDPDEAKVKSIVGGLKGIYVKSFEFEKEGEYSPSELDEIRRQLRGPGWSRMVGVMSKKGGDNAEIYMKLDNDHIGGLVILCAEPKELTVVNIVGNISLDDLSALGGHFGVPDIDTHKKAAKE